MNERDAYRVMMWAGLILGVVTAASAVMLLVLTVTKGMWLLLPTVLLAVASVGCAAGTIEFAKRFTGHAKVFSNQIEQEVLTRKQRHELRKQRGELVMQRSLIEIENERDNMIHRQIEAANDPDKPPHQTRFGDDQPVAPSLPRPRKRVSPEDRWLEDD